VRTAAGIMMMTLGVTSVSTRIFLSFVYDYPLTISMLMIGWSILAVIGGFLCLKRRYWGICLASALFVVVFGVGGFSLSSAFSWFVVVVGIVATILIALGKKDWQAVSD
jgi:hypothetical protein